MGSHWNHMPSGLSGVAGVIARVAETDHQKVTALGVTLDEEN